MFPHPWPPVLAVIALALAVSLWLAGAFPLIDPDEGRNAEVAREMMERGDAIIPKQGFSPPFSAWARGPMRGLVDDALSAARVARGGLLDPRAVGEIVDAHLENRADRGRTLWTLLSLQMWAERWVAGDEDAMWAEATAPAPADARPAPVEATADTRA